MSRLSPEYIEKALSDAPPVTQEQRERIARLLTPAATEGDR